MLISVIAVLSGCQPASTDRAIAPESIPHVVTADIQEGIERYIEEKTRADGGYFALPFEDEDLRLKLVRVHTEYLANLGPRRHFACVDLAGADGNVYDVDFFLAGDPGAMTVTETTVHKINGQPLYLWKQKTDGTWARTPVHDAPPELLGVVRERDRFEFVYQLTLPTLSDDAKMWIPLPGADQFQSVEVTQMRTPGKRRIITDQRYGNKVLYLELEPDDSGEAIDIRAEVERREKSVYSDFNASPEEFLAAERLVPIDDELRAVAEKVLSGQSGELRRARTLYDHTIDRMRYMRFGSGYGKGDALYARETGAGNCTDFHAYFIALARAAGIPARFAIGAAVPSERDLGGIDGYHCWAEFYADGQWWPVDISEADKYSALATYYFGRNPANRVELSRGRDLLLEPGPVSGPINFLADPVLEVAGQTIPIKPQMGFRRIAFNSVSPPNEQSIDTSGP